MRSSVLVLALLLAACGDRETTTQPASDAQAPAAPAAPAVDRAPSGVVPAAPAPDAPPTSPASEPPLISTPPATKSEIQARYTPHLANCLETGDAARGVTWAMAGCVGEELKLQDGALNAEYQRVIRLLPAERAENLRLAERAWIQYRNATCLAQRTGGTIDQINVLYCHLDQTISRTIDLERMGVR